MLALAVLDYAFISGVRQSEVNWTPSVSSVYLLWLSVGWAEETQTFYPKPSNLWYLFFGTIFICYFFPPGEEIFNILLWGGDLSLAPGILEEGRRKVLLQSHCQLHILLHRISPSLSGRQWWGLGREQPQTFAGEAWERTMNLTSVHVDFPFNLSLQSL